MVGMRQVTALIGVAEQGYVEACMQRTGAVLRVGMHAVAGTGTHATMERALRRLGSCTALTLAVGFE